LRAKNLLGEAHHLRDHAHTLLDFLVPTRSIECEPCGRRGRYNVAKLIERYGDMKLPELRHVLADCPKAKSQSIHDGIDTGTLAGFGPAAMMANDNDLIRSSPIPA
jgi:hypothetical protein